MVGVGRPDRELDESFVRKVLFSIRILQHRAGCPLHAALDEQLEVIRARLVLIETVTKREAQAIEAEVFRAAMIRPIQKRTMRRGLLVTDS